MFALLYQAFSCRSSYQVYEYHTHTLSLRIQQYSSFVMSPKMAESYSAFYVGTNPHTYTLSGMLRHAEKHQECGICTTFLTVDLPSLLPYWTLTNSLCETIVKQWNHYCHNRNGCCIKLSLHGMGANNILSSTLQFVKEETVRYQHGLHLLIARTNKLSRATGLFI